MMTEKKPQAGEKIQKGDEYWCRLSNRFRHSNGIGNTIEADDTPRNHEFSGYCVRRRVTAPEEPLVRMYADTSGYTYYADKPKQTTHSVVITDESGKTVLKPVSP